MSDPKNPESPESKNAAKIAELREKHGELLVIDNPKVGLFAFAKPSDANYSRFFDKVNKGEESRYSAAKELARCSVVHPGVDEFDTLIARFPAVVNKLADGLSKLAGSTIEFDILGN